MNPFITDDEPFINVQNKKEDPDIPPIPLPIDNTEEYVRWGLIALTGVMISYIFMKYNKIKI